MPKLGLLVRRQLREAVEPVWATTTLLLADKNTIPDSPSKSDLVEMMVNWTNEM